MDSVFSTKIVGTRSDIEKLFLGPLLSYESKQNIKRGDFINFRVLLLKFFISKNMIYGKHCKNTHFSPVRLYFNSCKIYLFTHITPQYHFLGFRNKNRKQNPYRQLIVFVYPYICPPSAST